MFDHRSGSRLRRLFRIVALALVALGAPAMSPATALSADEARHLLTRSGFGATAAEVAALVPLDRAAAVDRILGQTRRTTHVAPPAFLSGPWPAYRDMPAMTAEQRDTFLQARRAEIHDLKTWWLVEMIATPSPLTERMTLFWHNHFVSAFEAVGQNVHRLWNQNDLFRREGTGNFAALLRAALTDPILLRYLDAQTNRKGRPNENLARELLELFTLGEGHYTEADIREIARALTGLGIDRQTQWDFRFLPGAHDSGPKHFLGATGESAEDVIQVLLAHPRTASFIVEKLWRDFVSPMPDPVSVASIAAVFRDGGYAIKPALRALFLSEAFWDPRMRGALIKSPAILIAGLHRDLGLPLVDPASLAAHARRLGQDLFEPPNVRGWQGGETWITPASLVARSDVLTRLLDNRGLVAAPLPAGAAAIAIRVAGDAWQGPPVMRVTINDGVRVAEQPITFAHDTDRHGRSPDRNDWVWRVLRFPVDRAVDRVTISFVNDAAAPLPRDGGRRGDRNLFIDWVEVEGRIHLATRATLRAGAAACPRGRGGDLYCNGDLEFDIAGARGALSNGGSGAGGPGMAGSGGMTATGMTASAAAARRMPGLDRVVHGDAAAWRASLPVPWQAAPERWRALVPVPPVDAEPSVDDETLLRALVLDPAYHLL
jgi:uncharacterized protein (DUF1800 family)